MRVKPAGASGYAHDVIGSLHPAPDPDSPDPDSVGAGRALSSPRPRRPRALHGFWAWNATFIPMPVACGTGSCMAVD